MEGFGKNHNTLIEILKHLELSEINGCCIANKECQAKICRDKFYRAWLRYSNPNIKIPDYDISDWIQNYRNLLYKTNTETTELFRGVLSGSIVEHYPYIYFIAIDNTSYRFDQESFKIEKIRENVKYQDRYCYLTLDNELFFYKGESVKNVFKVFSYNTFVFYLTDTGEFYSNYANSDDRFKNKFGSSIRKENMARIMPNIKDFYITSYLDIYTKSIDDKWSGAKLLQYSISGRQVFLKNKKFIDNVNLYGIIGNLFYILSDKQLYRLVAGDWELKNGERSLKARKIPTDVDIKSLSGGFIKSYTGEMYTVKHDELYKIKDYPKITTEIVLSDMDNEFILQY